MWVMDGERINGEISSGKWERWQVFVSFVKILRYSSLYKPKSNIRTPGPATGCNSSPEVINRVSCANCRLSTKCVMNVKVRDLNTTSWNLFRCVIHQTPLYLSFWRTRAFAQHQARCLSPTEGPPGPREPMKTDCGRVYALRCTAVAGVGPGGRVRRPSVSLRPSYRFAVESWKPHLASGDRIKNKMPPLPVATCAENCIGSIWYNAHSTRQRGVIRDSSYVAGLWSSAVSRDQGKGSHRTFMSHPSESLTGKNYTIGLRNTQYTKIAHEELANNNNFLLNWRGQANYSEHSHSKSSPFICYHNLLGIVRIIKMKFINTRSIRFLDHRVYAALRWLLAEQWRDSKQAFYTICTT